MNNFAVKSTKCGKNLWSVYEIHNSVNRKTSKGEILSSTVGNLANVITILAGIPETVNVVSNGLCLFKNLIDMI